LAEFPYVHCPDAAAAKLGDLLRCRYGACVPHAVFHGQSAGGWPRPCLCRVLRRKTRPHNNASRCGSLRTPPQACKRRARRRRRCHAYRNNARSPFPHVRTDSPLAVSQCQGTLPPRPLRSRTTTRYCHQNRQCTSLHTHLRACFCAVHTPIYPHMCGAASAAHWPSSIFGDAPFSR